MTTDSTAHDANGVASPVRKRRVKTPIVVPDTIGSNALARQYRAEHVPTRAPHETAALLLARAGDRLEHRTVAHYIRSTGDAIRHRRVPADVRLSEDAVRLALEAPLSWVTVDWHHVERPWESLLSDELLTLLSVGFGEDARYWELCEAKEAGDLDPATLDWDDYVRVFGVDRQPEAIFTVFLGWLPGLLAGIVAGIVVVLITGSVGFALGTVVLAPALGYGLTLLLASALDYEDRERHLGEKYGRAFGMLYLGSGPAAAVGCAVVALLLHALLNL